MTDPHAEEEHHDEKDHGHTHGESEPHDHKEAAPEGKGGGVTFEKIPVVKGTTDIGYTEITPLKEIPAHAKIVVKGRSSYWRK